MARRGESAEQSLNLIPIMNMVSLLIPFLLMAAQFVALGVIDSTLPSMGASADAADNPENEARPLLLSLRIHPEGFRLQGADAALGVQAGAGLAIPCAGGVCGSPEAYDFQRLREALHRVKDAHPAERTIILVPDGRIPYELLIHAMDATREDPARLNAEGQPRELFPSVVIAGGAS